MSSTELRTDSKSMWLAKVGVIIGGSILGTLVPVALVTALPDLAKHFFPNGGGEFYAQEVAAFPALTIIIGAPLSGFLAERFGMRRCLLPMLVIYTLAGAWGLFASDMTSLLISRLILGLVGGGVMTLSLTSAAIFFESGERERILGFGYATSGIAAILVNIISGWAVDFAGWRVSFSFYLLGVLVFVISFIALRGTKSVAAPEQSAVQGSFKSLLGLTPVYVLLLILSVGIWTMGIQSPFLLAANGITSAKLIGLVISCSAISTAFSSASFGFLRRRLTDRTILMMAAVVMGSAIAIVGIIHNVAIIAAGFFVFGLGSGLCAPGFSSIILSTAPEAIRARATGFMTSMIFLAQFLTPLIISPLSIHLGVHGAFIALGIFLFLMVLVVPFIGYRRTRARLA